MVKKKSFPFLFSAVSGAVAAYYGSAFTAGKGMALSGLVFPALILLLVPFSLFLSFSVLPQGSFAGKRFCRSGSIHTLAFALGFLAGFSAFLSIPGAPSLGLSPERIRGISGILTDDPRLSTGNRGIGYMELERSAGEGGLRVSARGKIPVMFPLEHLDRLKEFGKGSRIYAEGSFGELNEGRPFFRAESIHVIKAAPPLEKMRTGVRLALVKLFSSRGKKWGGLALALLLGIRDNLETEFAVLYRNAGASHVLALSGMHLAVVSAMISFLLRKPLGFRAAAVSGLFFIASYVFLIGDLPSLHRAAIMYALGTVALLGYLPRKALALLALSFLVQIAVQSESGQSLSFMLSYLALWGILVIGEGFHELLRGKIPEKLLSPLAASIGAFIATAPLSCLFFGILRPAGIVTGLLIVPLTSLFMIGAMIYIPLSLFPLPAAFLAALLSFFYDGLYRLASLAGNFPAMKLPNPVPVLILSLVMTLIILLWARRRASDGERLPAFAEL
jgi:competence protein ComEC